jgi:hypothetical protein
MSDKFSYGSCWPNVTTKLPKFKSKFINYEEWFIVQEIDKDLNLTSKAVLKGKKGPGRIYLYEMKRLSGAATCRFNFHVAHLQTYT